MSSSQVLCIVISSWWFQTQLKNMFVKFDHFPKDRAKKKQKVEITT